ncbi:NACHT domain-containing protein [Actinokineospora enzanensis]|uniref:NACHT domain-containing protein n=1 Tax=Actinokineospora enzanensis TaxID=155975 RepID=UPI00035F4D2C|nr:NACHT domain-containing protein [Actinokineospora enzanensis]
MGETWMWAVLVVAAIPLALVVDRHRRPSFDRRYQAFILRTLHFIDLKGLQTLSHTGLAFDAVYIELSLVQRAPHEVGTHLLPEIPHDTRERFRIERTLDRDQPSLLVVLGGPGSGKTTLLRKTAREICQSSWRRSVPMLLYLRDHIPAITEGAPLPALMRAKLGLLAQHEPTGWFDRQLADGRCVVMLDGLDEVAAADDRARVSAWVDEQVRQYPTNDFVVTSRPQGYHDGPIEGATVLQVRPFTTGQVRTFVHGWYRALIQPGTGESAEAARDLARQDADDLLTRLDAAPALGDLTVNPLLLTMIATVHRFRGALPGSRAELYREICEVMLWQRQKAKNLPVGQRSRYKLTLLRAAAFEMMSRGVRQLPRLEVLEQFTKLLRRLSTPLNAEDYLRETMSDGLLVEWEKDEFGFAHMTFQEYLAATHIQDRGLVDTLVYAVDDLWWRETTLLYTANADADPIMIACLASGTAPALALALDCLTEGVEMAEDLRLDLERLLESVVDDSLGAERRPVIARVLATRLLRDTVPTANDVSMLCGPVPANLYRLYLTDTGQTELTAGRGNEPVAGASFINAHEFSRWLTKISGARKRFRLPTETEAQQGRPKLDGLALWTSSGDLWALEKPAEPITDVDLQRQITNDFVAQLFPYVEGWQTYNRTLQIVERRRGIRVPPIWPDTDHDWSSTPVSSHTDLVLFHRRPTSSALAQGSVGSVLSLPRNAGERWTFRNQWGMAVSEVFADHIVRDLKEDFVSTAARRFLVVTGVADLHVEPVEVGELPGMLDRLCTFLDENSGSWTWYQVMAARLRQLATGPFTGGLVDAETAAKVRLLSVTLASEPIVRNLLQRQRLLYFATGITLLERRWAGQLPPRETIVLAVTQ